MYEITVECGECGNKRTIRCDASGFAPGVRMRCPKCNRSAEHYPVGDLRPADANEMEHAMATVDEDRQRAQSAAYDFEDN